MQTVSIMRTFSSRATIAAGTSPPRVMQTSASNGPASCSRQASARKSRWNWSQDTGKIFSGRGGSFAFAIKASPLSIWTARPRESGDPALDSRLRGNERRKSQSL